MCAARARASERANAHCAKLARIPPPRKRKNIRSVGPWGDQKFHANNTDRRHQRNGHRVRVISHRLEGPGAPGETYRLITTLLDWKTHPAATLAALHPQRWEIDQRQGEARGCGCGRGGG
jgi:hypothetical protein